MPSILGSSWRKSGRARGRPRLLTLWALGCLLGAACGPSGETGARPDPSRPTVAAVPGSTAAERISPDSISVDGAPPSSHSAEDAQVVEVVFLDVGQGDATLIRTPDGRTALVDAGPGDPTDQLRALGVERIDLLVATHAHADHIGGMRHVLAAFPVGTYMDNGKPHTTATYLELMRTLRARTDIAYLEATPRTLTLGSVTLQVLPLPPPEVVDHNDRSIGLVLRYSAFAAFLSGDSERRLLTHFLDHGAVPDVTLLKAPHHGSRNGVTPAFLSTARPDVVVIPLGRNSYGHPHPEAMEAYQRVTRAIYRTDIHGRVTVRGRTDGSFDVGTER